MDFGFAGGASGSTTVATPPVDNGNQPPINQPVPPDDGNEPQTKDEPKDPPADVPAHDIAAGTEVEFEGQTYKVADNGDIVDAEGKVFKEAKDVKDWVSSLEQAQTDEDTFDIKDLQEAIGIDITDNEGKNIEFENSKEGITSYVKQVIDSSREENYKEAIQGLFSKFPILEEVLTYYQANGNSIEGFRQQVDRSNIEIDANNEEQQENIIKISWKEKGIKGDVDGYIAYLKSSGTLFTTAQSELESLQEKDAQDKKALQERAARAEKEQEEQIAKYWNDVKTVVDSGKVAGYEIPNNITINRDGKKISVTRSDFFNYIYRVDKNGKSQYVYDLEKESAEEQINNDILRAYLKYVGGDYSDLVKIAANKKEVERIKLQAKNNKTNTIRFKAPQPKNNTGKIDFGV